MSKSLLSKIGVLSSVLVGVLAVSMVWFFLINVVVECGTVRYLDFEGGFYGIVGDSGKRYDPVNLDDRFKVDGLRVRFVATVLWDYVSFHMWGQLVSIVYVAEL